MIPLLLLSILSTQIYAGSILFLPSTLYPSHSFVMSHLANELVQRGHQVQWVEIGPKQSGTVLDKSVGRQHWPVQFAEQELTDIYVHRNHSSYQKVWNPGFNNENEQTTGWLASMNLCNSALTRYRTKFDGLIQQKFDTIIIDDLYNPCGVLLAGLKKSVYIYWSMTSLRTESAWSNQSPSPPSYLPVAGTGLTDDLTFGERIYNVASYFKQLYIHQHIVQPRVDAIYQKHYPGVPSMFDIERNASINFVNTPPIFDFARPYMPRVNFVGGLHCHKPNTLPTDYQKATNTKFVVLSSGFTNSWSTAPIHLKTWIIDTFKSMPDIQFIWQYSNPDQLQKLPTNILVKAWLPLQDLLGHKNCIAHISHGGLNSLIESVWHGVPVIGVPLTIGGYDNLLRISARDAGVIVEKENWSGDALKYAIREVIGDKKYKEEMKIFQDMVTDVPYSELYHAAFWVEFIDRHGEVPHARSGADKLNVLQYFLVDVILFFFFVIYCCVATVYLTIRTIWRMVWKVLVMVGVVKKVTVAKKTN